MSKLRALLVGATAAGALAAGSLIPAHATTQTVGPVTITQDGDSGSLYVDGGANGYLDAHGDASDQEGDICGEGFGQGGCVSDLPLP